VVPQGNATHNAKRRNTRSPKKKGGERAGKKGEILGYASKGGRPQKDLSWKTGTPRLWQNGVGKHKKQTTSRRPTHEESGGIGLSARMNMWEGCPNKEGKWVGWFSGQASR